MDLSVTLLASRFVARVDHNLSDSADPALGEALNTALRNHRLLVFPGQHLNHGDLLEVSGLFGAVDTDIDRRYAVGGFPGITVVSNIAEHGDQIGIYDGDHEQEWHADNSFKADLTRATLLYSVITPEHGGETRFADATRAYADLPYARGGRTGALQQPSWPACWPTRADQRERKASSCTATPHHRRTCRP